MIAVLPANVEACDIEVGSVGCAATPADIQGMSRRNICTLADDPSES